MTKQPEGTEFDMQTSEEHTALSFVKGDMYDMSLTDVASHRYTFSRSKSDDLINETSVLSLSAILKFQQIPDYSEQITVNLKTLDPYDLDRVGFVSINPAHPCIQLIADDAKIMRIMDALVAGRDLDFEITGRAQGELWLEVTDYGYEHAL